LTLDPARKLVAEFIGTFALVFALVGTLVVLGQDLLAVAFANGLVLAVMIAAFIGVSGGHFNPAITLAMLFSRKIDAIGAVSYWVAQYAGAIAAMLVLKATIGDVPQVDLGVGVPKVYAELELWQAVTIEGFVTFFVVMVVLGTAAYVRNGPSPLAPVAIGLTFTVGVLMAAVWTGAAMNPARALGPELVERDWKNWWVYLAGPVAGAVLAALVAMLVFEHDADADEVVELDEGEDEDEVVEVEDTVEVEDLGAPDAPEDS
jgi:MIP family channel proteins